ncbi:Nuclear factor 1 A-type [Gossypium arboreum]|uniref:Nuclear factor 1 A-type n=1 Tax=Gossypium arboreum TaxID=29729 RepID=A0A0B0PJ90_GOSAR|nr:Nuclear factor 1 A-type [Gossypium arboreum]
MIVLSMTLHAHNIYDTTYCMRLGFLYGGSSVLVTMSHSLLLVALPHLLFLAAMLHYYYWQLCYDIGVLAWWVDLYPHMVCWLVRMVCWLDLGRMHNCITLYRIVTALGVGPHCY